jgi:hypothetical protein
MQLIEIELITSAKHKLSQRPRRRARKARIRLVIEGRLRDAQTEMGLELTSPRRSPGSSPAPRSACSPAPSACTSTPCSAAHHARLAAYTDMHPHQSLGPPAASGFNTTPPGAPDLPRRNRGAQRSFRPRIAPHHATRQGHGHHDVRRAVPRSNSTRAGFSAGSTPPLGTSTRPNSRGSTSSSARLAAKSGSRANPSTGPKRSAESSRAPIRPTFPTSRPRSGLALTRWLGP